MTHVTPVRQLGALEAQVMDYIWRMGSASVREVHERLSAERDFAYTTVLTVMQRLAEKGFLVRIQHGRSHIYAAKLSRDEYYDSLFSTVMASLSKSAVEKTLVHFVEEIDDDKVLAELERLIREKRAVV